MSQERIKKSFAKIINILDELQTIPNLPDAGLQANEDNKEAVQARYKDIMERVMTTIQEIATFPAIIAAAPSPAVANCANTTPRIIDSLKPEKLTEGHNPVKFRSWASQWRLDVLGLEDQQQYFRVCIDPTLFDNISSSIDAQTPILSTGGCIDILMQEFNQIYPLATRKMAYFHFSQDQGESFSSFTRQLKKIGNEADLQNI